MGRTSEFSDVQWLDHNNVSDSPQTSPRLASDQSHTNLRPVSSDSLQTHLRLVLDLPQTCLRLVSDPPQTRLMITGEHWSADRPKSQDHHLHMIDLSPSPDCRGPDSGVKSHLNKCNKNILSKTDKWKLNLMRNFRLGVTPQNFWFCSCEINGERMKRWQQNLCLNQVIGNRTHLFLAVTACTPGIFFPSRQLCSVRQPGGGDGLSGLKTPLDLQDKEAFKNEARRRRCDGTRSRYI